MRLRASLRKPHLMKQRDVVHICAFTLGTIASQAAFFHSAHLVALPRRTGIAVAFAFAVALTVLLWVPTRYLVGACKSLGRRSICLSLLAALITGWLATYAIPVRIAPSGTPASITITATGQHDPRARGAEVWVRLIADGSPVPSSSLHTDGSWHDRDGWLVSINDSPAHVRWSGKVNASLVALFVSHPWSGRAIVDFNGTSQAFDLYADAPSPPRAVQLIPSSGSRFLAFPPRTGLQRWVQACDAVLIGVGLFTLLLWLTGADAYESLNLRKGGRPHDILRFATPSLVCSVVLLTVFYPGLMTSDSTDQWNQASTGVYNDWHPFYHSLMIAGLRHLWNSPAVVACFQASLIAFSTGWLIAATLRATDAPRLLGHLAAWLCALCPIIAIYSVTLWKDIPYSASVVAITAGCVSVVNRQGLDLRRPWTFLLSAVVLVSCMLLRHNGPPVAFAALTMGWLMVRALRKTIIALAITVVASFLILSGPVPDLLHVKRTHVVFTVALHHIAAHLAAGDSLDHPKDLALLHEIRPEGPLQYSCATVDRTIFDPKINNAVAAANVGALLSMEARLAERYPMTEVRHLLCVSGLVWRVTTDFGQPLYLSTFSLYTENGHVRWMANNSQGLRENSLLPLVANALGKFVLSIKSELILRPASYMYLFVFALAVAWRRMEGWRTVVAVGTAPLVHCAVLLGANVAQDARYQLPIYIVALAASPLLLAAQRLRADLASSAA